LNLNFVGGALELICTIGYDYYGTYWNNGAVKGGAIFNEFTFMYTVGTTFIENFANEGFAIYITSMAEHYGTDTIFTSTFCKLKR
jgi:hypothetical protein